MPWSTTLRVPGYNLRKGRVEEAEMSPETQGSKPGKCGLHKWKMLEI